MRSNAIMLLLVCLVISCGSKETKTTTNDKLPALKKTDNQEYSEYLKFTKLRSEIETFAKSAKKVSLENLFKKYGFTPEGLCAEEGIITLLSSKNTKINQDNSGFLIFLNIDTKTNTCLKEMPSICGVSYTKAKGVKLSDIKVSYYMGLFSNIESSIISPEFISFSWAINDDGSCNKNSDPDSSQSSKHYTVASLRNGKFHVLTEYSDSKTVDMNADISSENSHKIFFIKKINLYIFSLYTKRFGIEPKGDGETAEVSTSSTVCQVINEKNKLLKLSNESIKKYLEMLDKESDEYGLLTECNTSNDKY